MTCTQCGRQRSQALALDIQSEYLNRCCGSPSTMTSPMRSRWRSICGHVLTHLEDDLLKLDRELDWVIKQADRGLPRTPRPESQRWRVALVDLQYHDANRERGLFYRLQRRDMVDRMVTDEEISHG